MRQALFALIAIVTLVFAAAGAHRRVTPNARRCVRATAFKHPFSIFAIRPCGSRYTNNSSQ